MAGGPPQGRPLSTEERRLIACAAAELFRPAQVFAGGKRPLLVVNAKPAGAITFPHGDCPNPPLLPRKAREIRYLKAEAAVKLWGTEGRHGAVVIELEEQEKSLTGPR